MPKSLDGRSEIKETTGTSDWPKEVLQELQRDEGYQWTAFHRVFLSDKRVTYLGEWVRVGC